MVREIGSVSTLEGKSIAVAVNGPKVIVIGPIGGNALSPKNAQTLSTYIRSAADLADRY